MSNGLREINLTDPEWGEIKILVPTPRDNDPWGVLAPLKDTPWGNQIQIVSGDALSHALHGWATPLMQEIGIPPRAHANKIPDADGICSLISECVGAGAHCRPGRNTPGCYEPPKLGFPVNMLVTAIVQAWVEGRYVVVVEGKGFVVS